MENKYLKHIVCKCKSEIWIEKWEEWWSKFVYVFTTENCTFSSLLRLKKKMISEKIRFKSQKEKGKLQEVGTLNLD